LVRDAAESAWRGAELCQSLLAFGRRQALSPEKADINALVGRVEKLIRRTIGDSILVRMSLGTDLPSVLIDQGRLENAILNLVINARDAMSEGGTIIVRTDLFHADVAYAQSHPDMAAGDYVRVEVSDTGSGMPPEVRDRSMEPFFTTKAKGKGTGLGLSMVYGLLKQSGGHVRICSEVGRGTSVKLFVPAIADPEGQSISTAHLLSPGLGPGGQNPRRMLD
jgi:signal transduction histidine kinase